MNMPNLIHHLKPLRAQRPATRRTDPQAFIEITDPRSREWLPPLPRMRYYD